jgi:hypothetical protein
MDSLIEIQTSEDLPEVNDEMPMQSIADSMLESVQMNFMLGGRPNPWVMKHPNETPLVASGRLYNSLEKTSGTDWAQVEVPMSVVSSEGFYYPRALNDGAEVPPVEGKLMVFEVEGRTIFTYKRRGFHLGPFEFMMFQDEDIESILQMCSEAIFTKG